MIVIGLTGGIGSGKSTAAAILREKGAYVIDADRVGHDIYKGGSEGWREVVGAFGEGIVGANGEIDRKKLGEIVFDGPAALERLNAITHPRIRAELSRRLDEQRQADRPIAVVEAALLVEGGWHNLVDEVWVLTVPDETAIERSIARGRSREQVQAILRSQISNEERKRHADAVIDNSGSFADLERRLDELWQALEGRTASATATGNRD